MGIVIVGGLMISLLFTLYVIPAMYTYLSKDKSAKRVKTPVKEPAKEESFVSEIFKFK